MERSFEEATTRKLHTFLGFWRICNDKRCIRGRSCAGDVNLCGKKFYPLVPDNLKYALSEGIKKRLAEIRSGVDE